MNREAWVEMARQMEMVPERLCRARDLLDQEVARGTIPGASVIIGRRGERVYYATGYSVFTDLQKIEVKRDTLYDCASLTKVVITLPLILMLVDRGQLRLDEPVAEYLPEFAACGKAAVTVNQLLTHTSGLAAFIDLHSQAWSREEILSHICGQPLEYDPGTSMVYSDLGFILLGEMIAKLHGSSLDLVANRELFQPLGMKDSGYCPPEELQSRIAATEFIPEEGAYRWGKVHDSNALALGGVSGHAGLFSTADDLASYAELWLAEGQVNGQSLLSPAAIKRAVSSQTRPKLQANRGLGWVLQGDQWDASGDLMSDVAYGHTGFTGTSLWTDPVSGVYVVLLTNRVHFGRERSVARLRCLMHNIVAASIVSTL